MFALINFESLELTIVEKEKDHMHHMFFNWLFFVEYVLIFHLYLYFTISDVFCGVLHKIDCSVRKSGWIATNLTVLQQPLTINLWRRMIWCIFKSNDLIGVNKLLEFQIVIYFNYVKFSSAILVFIIAVTGHCDCQSRCDHNLIIKPGRNVFKLFVFNICFTHYLHC